MIKKILAISIFISVNVSANTAWIPQWQAYKPTNWQTAGVFYSCVSFTNISSGSVDIAVNYYNDSGEIVTPQLFGSSSTAKATLGVRQSVYWCTDTKQISAGTNMWGSGTVTATPLDGQTDPSLVIALADLRNMSPVGSIIGWKHLQINGGQPF